MHNEQIHSVLDLISLPIDRFVGESYRILLGRTPSPSERMERAGALRAGLGRIRFLADMGQSPEYRQRQDRMLHTDDTAFVHAIFQRYLNRVPDSEGFQHYTRLLARGQSRARIARDIARSREARAKRTFWFEFEHLSTVDRAERHWLRRWLGHGTRQRRLRNLRLEALLRRNATYDQISQHLPAAAGPNMLSPYAIDDAAHLHIDTRSQGHATRRAISRLQHVAGSF